MCEALDLFSVRLPDFARTTTFRWTLAVAGACSLCTFLLFGFVYWRTATYLTSSIDVLLAGELRLFASDAPERRLTEIDNRLRHDPRGIRVAGLFDAGGRRIAGNIENLPPGFVPEVPANAVIARVESGRRELQKVRLIAERLPGGDILV